MAGHFLALEDLARILAVAGRALFAVAHRDAVGGPQAPEPMAFYDPGKPLADGRPGDIDILAADEMVGRELRADLDQRVGADPELGQLPLGLNLGLGEMAAHGLGHVLDLGSTEPELDGRIAVALRGAGRHHLATVDLQHGHGHVRAVFGEDAGHPDLLCDESGSHERGPFRA